VSIDLHIHTTASDGTLAPAAVVALARQLGLSAIAITDHDTVDGVHQILEDGPPQNIHFLSGVELSTSPPEGFPCRGSLHLLGYGFRHDDLDLGRHLEKLQKARSDRNPRIIARLQALGIDIDLAELEAPGQKRQTGRPHIAKLLLEKGVVQSFDEAFDRFLGNDKPAYVDKYRIPCREAIELIRRAGGVSALAHPGLIHPTRSWRLEDLLDTLKAAGLQGLEVYYPEHSRDQTRRFHELARHYGLAVTGGTDFHGAIKPGVALGRADGTFAVPFHVYEQLAALL
jgi:predicted metal-dependent phosphoesterase TrpH